MTKQDYALPTGTIVAKKYRIERLVGEGGMGEVYEATQLPIGRRVALKVLHGEYATDPGVVARFQREAEAAGSIGHDNICEVTDVGVAEDGLPFLVMPLLKGRPLSAFLASGEISMRRLVDILGQTLSALRAAHEAHIIHRDLKPDNIFVSHFGDREDFVKLLDFGIAKVFDGDVVSNLTRTGTVLGTPYYMAPEQARGAKQIDLRVDLYAIGVILYEGLTGHRPFDGDTYNEIMFRIISEPFAPPRALNPAIPHDLEKVLARAMARDPEQRFQTAAEMRNALLAADLVSVGDSFPPPPPLRARDTKPVGERTPPPAADTSSGNRAGNTAGSMIETPGGWNLSRVEEQKRSRTPMMIGIAVGAMAFVAALVATLLLVLGRGHGVQSPASVVPLQAPSSVSPPASVPPKPLPLPLPLPNAAVTADMPADTTTDKEVKKPADMATSKESKKSASRRSSGDSKKSVKGRFGTKIDADY